jgi:hypothetical protein
MSERRDPNVVDHFGSLFDIALVLLGVLSATETQYFVKFWNDRTALKFAVYPFLIIIPVWLLKELYKRQFERENRTAVFLVLSEFCWEIWILSLSYYLLFLAVYLVPISAIDFSYAVIIGAILFGLVLGAYAVEYRKGVSHYYKSRKWILIRGILMVVGALIVYIIFLPIP